MFKSIGVVELLIIFFIIIFLFGGKKIPEFIKGITDAVREFKRTSKEK